MTASTDIDVATSSRMTHAARLTSPVSGGGSSFEHAFDWTFSRREPAAQAYRLVHVATGLGSPRKALVDTVLSTLDCVPDDEATIIDAIEGMGLPGRVSSFLLHVSDDGMTVWFDTDPGETETYVKMQATEAFLAGHGSVAYWSR